MTIIDGGPTPRPPWPDEGFIRGEIHVKGPDLETVLLAISAAGVPGDGLAVIPLGFGWWRVDVPVGQERYWARQVRDAGRPAVVNPILRFDTAPAAPFVASPFVASPFVASPFVASPFVASPFVASPFVASPFVASPFVASDFTVPFVGNPTYGNPVPYEAYKTGSVRPSAARVALAPHWCELPPSPANVIVVDTGLAGIDPSTFVDHTNTVLRLRFGLNSGFDVPDSNSDGYLDPVAGHGTFITGVIEMLGHPSTLAAPGPIPPFAYLDVGVLLPVLSSYLGQVTDQTIVNMSFSSTLEADMLALADAVGAVQNLGGVVVASAGNDASWVPTYPAALPGVVGVGGLGPYGPAPFTNWGPWVRACAPAVDVVSTFFEDFNGDVPQLDAMGDPDDFDGWAVWSGTSFAAPAVVAALCREMLLCGGTAQDAVATVIDGPGLHRVPGLGTVINLAVEPSCAPPPPPANWIHIPEMAFDGGGAIEPGGLDVGSARDLGAETPPDLGIPVPPGILRFIRLATAEAAPQRPAKKAGKRPAKKKAPAKKAAAKKVPPKKAAAKKAPAKKAAAKKAAGRR